MRPMTSGSSTTATCGRCSATSSAAPTIPQVAADLTAETFASAIVAQGRYVATGAPALAWLYTIASRRLVDYQRRGAVERKLQRALAMERPPPERRGRGR